MTERTPTASLILPDRFVAALVQQEFVMDLIAPRSLAKRLTHMRDPIALRAAREERRRISAGKSD
jgi:hypothetical protein